MQENLTPPRKGLTLSTSQLGHTLLAIAIGYVWGWKAPSWDRKI